ncbi:MAG: DNA adenine methylase [Alphaproteobacteria bacterium]|nr:DNA adenine methylase [Alphaproteobacteria bacterium]
MAKIPHTTYAEPFVGMGGVFLRRTESAPVEVINDISQDVSTIFSILQRHYAAFMEMLKFQLTTRAEFERLCNVDPSTQTDLERAARFLYLQRTAFGGKVVVRNFGVSVAEPAAFNVTRLAPMLDELHERLAGVVIERLPWSDFIARYDRPETLFYLDPPYWGCERDYGDQFKRADFEHMAMQLRGIRGHFILSVNDVPELRKMYSWASLEGISLTYSVGGGENTQEAKELIISQRPKD